MAHAMGYRISRASRVCIRCRQRLSREFRPVGKSSQSVPEPEPCPETWPPRRRGRHARHNSPRRQRLGIAPASCYQACSCARYAGCCSWANCNPTAHAMGYRISRASRVCITWRRCLSREFRPFGKSSQGVPELEPSPGRWSPRRGRKTTAHGESRGTLGRTCRFSPRSGRNNS